MKPQVKLGLGFLGMPEKTIEDIDAALPAMERLLALYQDKVAPLFAEAKPDLDQAAPVLLEIINFVKE